MRRCVDAFSPTSLQKSWLSVLILELDSAVRNIALKFELLPLVKLFRSLLEQ